jgi:FkbM family methyltransferase
MPGMDITFTPRSRYTAALVKNMPRFRGYSAVGSALLRSLPWNPVAIMKVGDSEFSLDLRYRSQFAAVVAEPERAESRFIVDRLRAGEAFFDFGANWGYYSLLAAAQVGPAGLVVSVEANPAPFRQLAQATRSLSQVLAFNVAIAGVSGRLVGIQVKRMHGDTGGYVVPCATPGRGVATKTIDLLWEQLGRPNVRIMKLDIEGYEPLALSGASHFLRDGLTDYALIEVSDWCHARSGVSYENIYGRMRDGGFEFAYILDREPELLQSRCVAGHNVLFARRRL